MSDEVFDVVNERDEVVEQRPRPEVHRLGLRHRAVHILVFNARGEVFMQKRSQWKDCSAGLWDSSASGHLDTGEAYDACAARELREELGWDAGGALEPLFKVNACEATEQEFVWVYRLKAEGPFRLDPQEIAGGGWFTKSAVSRWIAEKPEELTSAFCRVWGLYLEYLRGRSGDR